MLSKISCYKHYLIFILKIALALLLIEFLFSHGGLNFNSIATVYQRVDLLLPALLCLFAGIIISGIRWWILLSFSKNKIHLKTILSLQMIGSFFSTWLPGAASGDAVRSIQI